ncbi:hypothetical protein FCK90_00225 [Kocuria coralli]|uniref:Uncharacterized protein n=1 Tax=Kocuria coralli TaxID=1461025 RepID=A0A5J5L1P9_9MICC|nr:hypothetical protein [Kocuria coralli]KAA9395498.1 hypothetical protein FCK90_00225 [Kocuria coralli]
MQIMGWVLAIGATMLVALVLALAAVSIYLAFARINRAGDQPRLIPHPGGRAVEFPVMTASRGNRTLPFHLRHGSPLPGLVRVTPDGLDYRPLRWVHVPADRILCVDVPYPSATAFFTVWVRDEPVVSVMAISRLAAEQCVVELALHHPLTPRAWELVAHRYQGGGYVPRVVSPDVARFS